jgi:hypothetical protein
MSLPNRTILLANLSSVATDTLGGPILVQLTAKDRITVNDLVYNNFECIRVVSPFVGNEVFLNYITDPVIQYDASLSRSSVPNYQSPSGEYFEFDTIKSNPLDIDRIYYDVSGVQETGWSDITIQDYIDNIDQVCVVFALADGSGTTVDMSVNNIELINEYKPQFTLANSFGLIKNYTRGYRALTEQKTYSSYAFLNRKNQLLKGLQKRIG